MRPPQPETCDKFGIDQASDRSRTPRDQTKRTRVKKKKKNTKEKNIRIEDGAEEQTSQHQHLDDFECDEATHTIIHRGKRFAKLKQHACPRGALMLAWGCFFAQETPSSLLLIDSVLVFLIGSAVIQLAYCVLVTSFPFNAFLGAFSVHVGQFVLLASLRSQVNPLNSSQFEFVSPERYISPLLFFSLSLSLVSFL
ncbi:oligosaccharyltransferase complex subunit epsilon [Puccinia graminis f. sp. tritici]|uniref:Dolichyl-diphosphooligosaccharide--protein glycosyltransferase subunit OST2 n=1 Tax=Puccinia graminis f. sp. tritici TaxID=56615 RepID=A0A5B0MHL2_PUCGR|nr:oligosaccharyltransferase complex subunit epsilon [Puccinia graminis f. sp. tritici]